MTSIDKDSYDTIGFDDKIITGAQKITLADTRINAFSSVSVPTENKEEVINTKTMQPVEESESNQSAGFFDKIKNFINLGSKNEEAQRVSNDSSLELGSKDQSGTINSCKDKLLKKLQENIEVEKSYQTFFLLLVIGLGLLCISLIFLPVIIISPYKFVLCFSFGSLTILTSFLFIYGTKSYFEILFSQNRFPFTLLFLASIFLGITFAWSNYFFFSLICSIFQLVSLIVFTLSFIPGGRSGISFIGSMVSSPFVNLWMRIRGQSYLPS